MAFNPDDPRCPTCGTELNRRNWLTSTYYPAERMTVHIHTCSGCWSIVAYAVRDRPVPGEPYVTHTLKVDD